MTDPDRELDELASVYLDEYASPSERARVDADPLAIERVELMRSVRAELLVPPSVVAADRDRHVLAALALFDEHVADSNHEVPVGLPAGVLSLDEARARRARRLAPVLSIAAAGILAIGVGVLATRSGDDNPAAIREAAVSSVAAPLAADESASSKVSPSGGGAGSEPPAVTAAAVPVGDSSLTIEAAPNTGPALADIVATSAAAELTSLDELDAVVDGVAAQQPAVGDSIRNTDGCPAQAGDLVASIVWQGQPAIVYVLPNLAERTSAVVVDATSCRVLASTALAG